MFCNCLQFSTLLAELLHECDVTKINSNRSQCVWFSERGFTATQKMDAAMREMLGSGGCAAGGSAAKGAVSQLADQILRPRPLYVDCPHMCYPFTKKNTKTKTIYYPNRIGRGPQIMHRPPPAAHAVHDCTCVLVATAGYVFLFACF